MNDPAIEAAQRHVDALAYGWDSRFRRDDLIAAAREALKPIRELSEAFSEFYKDRDDTFAAGIKHVLRDLGLLIYTTEGRGAGE